MNPVAQLTRREGEVAELIAWGATQKEIARILFVERKTVDKHIQTIYRKTECSKSNELSAWWFCKSFNISFSLSPLKRKVVVIVFLTLLIPKEIISVGEMLRTKRVEKIEVTYKNREDYA